ALARHVKAGVRLVATDLVRVGRRQVADAAVAQGGDAGPVVAERRPDPLPVSHEQLAPHAQVEEGTEREGADPDGDRLIAIRVFRLGRDQIGVGGGGDRVIRGVGRQVGSADDVGGGCSYGGGLASDV